MNQSSASFTSCAFRFLFISLGFAAGPAQAEINDDDGLRTGSTNTIGTDDFNGAFGTYNSVSGQSLAVGQSNTVFSTSLAAGYLNHVQEYSLAAGYNNTVEGTCIFATGSQNDSDVGSFAVSLLGESNFVQYSNMAILGGSYNFLQRQDNSMAFGANNSMLFPSGKTGSWNILIGVGNEISAAGIVGSALQQSYLFGSFNTTSESSAYVFGEGNIGQNKTVTLGTYASPVSSASLIVGNGTSSVRSNALVVLKNGNTSVQGSLTVGGVPAVTTSYLTANDYLKKANGTGAIAASSAVLAIGSNAKANASGALAIGPSAEAMSYSTVALGQNSQATSSYATAINFSAANGDYSFAAASSWAAGAHAIAIGGAWAMAESSIALGGYDSSAYMGNESYGKGAVTIGGATNYAEGEYSYATGWNSAAFGNHSHASGYQIRTDAYAVATGSRNLSAGSLLPNASSTAWNENGALFELGNGKPTTSEYSNAITTLKNGETTVTNKAWKAHFTATGKALEDPPATITDSEGRAFVVEGHTVLKGKVTIAQPQGDLSMGNYQ